MIETAAPPLKFYLGTHRPTWLERTSVPLFVSRHTMPKERFPRALGPWALDSGAFSELSMHGQWELTPGQYVAEVRRYAAEIGNMEWASIQDWMCEAEVLSRTGLTVRDHQEKTTSNYLKLREIAPEIPWAPVLQGWTPGEYLDHVDLYASAGVELRSLPVVGVGSVCRRQNTMRVGFLLCDLYEAGFHNLHGFGFKVSGLTSLLESSRGRDKPFPLASADSLAWSYQARREPAMPECRGEGHKNCANCLRFALDWRDRLMVSIERAGREVQRRFFE